MNLLHKALLCCALAWGLGGGGGPAAGDPAAADLAAGVQNDPASRMRTEVEFLLSAVGDSGCDFFRNGTWYDAKAAVAHLRLKYDALVHRDLIHDSADFIEKAASQSSLSGRPYAMRCAGGEPVPTHQWLNQVLARYRELHKQDAPPVVP